MKAPKLIFTVLSALLLIPAVQAGKEVDRLLSEYEKIETVTCQVRRIKEGVVGKMKFLSRVYYTNQDQIHAEGISPIKRRTIADGKHLYQYVEGDPKGFSRPIEDLSKQMQNSLRFVPGTAMEHLLLLKDKEETPLPSENLATKRVGIQTENNYVVLLLDAQGRLAGIEFYAEPDLIDKVADYEYHDFKEVLPGVWIPLSHRASITRSELNFKETVKIDRFIANQPIAASLFIPRNFFAENIDFVNDFAKIFPE